MVNTLYYCLSALWCDEITLRAFILYPYLNFVYLDKGVAEHVAVKLR